MNQLPTHQYAHNAAAICTELRALLTASEKQALAADIARHGAQALEEWAAWRSANAAEIAKFAHATSAQIRKAKAWSDPMLRARLTAAALLQLQDGQVLLSLLANYGSGIATGNSYRHAAQTAGWLVEELCRRLQHDPYWPFEDVPSPFA